MYNGNDKDQCWQYTNGNFSPYRKSDTHISLRTKHILQLDAHTLTPHRITLARTIFVTVTHQDEHRRYYTHTHTVLLFRHVKSAHGFSNNVAFYTIIIEISILEKYKNKVKKKNSNLSREWNIKISLCLDPTFRPILELM